MADGRHSPAPDGRLLWRRCLRDACGRGGCDRKVSTERWGEQSEPSKDPAERAWEGRHDTELSRLLLPVDEDHRLGPDIGEYGNDVEIGGAELVAAAKQNLRGLPQAMRRNLEKQIDRNGLEGVAMRSYTENALGIAYEDSEAHAAVRVESLKNRAAAEREHRLVVRSLRAGEGKPATKIKGHPQAYCHRVDLDIEYGYRQVLCSAARGEYLVILAAEASTEDALSDPSSCSGISSTISTPRGSTHDRANPAAYAR